MSTLKVAALQGLSASSDAITLANDGTCTANITNNLSNRNLIINGAMQVAQRGTSSTTYGYGSVDRWRNTQSAIGVTPTHSQQTATSSDTGIWEAGFRNYMRFALPSAGTNNAASWLGFTQFIEAQNIANSGWNYTSTSSYITVSFWIRASTNQTFYAYVGTRDGTRKRFSFAITASGNNTWTKITKTISGHADLQFDNNNDRGLDIGIIPHYGTDFTGTATLDSWVDNSGTNAFPDYATTWLTAGASTFDLTGVQLEVGSVATDFEHRSYAVEKRLCQRYYQQYLNPRLRGVRGGNNTDFHRMGMTLLVEMRSDPTLSWSGTQNVYDGDHLASITGIGTGYPDPMSVEFEASVSGTLGTGTGSAIVAYTGGNEGTLMLSAEL